MGKSGTPNLFGLKIISILLISRPAMCCQISLQEEEEFEGTFLFKEVDENLEIGKQLPGSFSIKFDSDLELTSRLLVTHNERSSESIRAKEYIQPTINSTSGTIEFYLIKSLRNYHLENWKPNVELTFSVLCSNDQTTWTYMIAIKDDNLHSPRFAEANYTGMIHYTPLHGFQVEFVSVNGSPDGIRVIDPDFNLKHADVSISCEGSSCSFFTFTTQHTGFHKGHNFDIDIFPNGNELLQFKDNVKDGDRLNFAISATDSVYYSSVAAGVTLKVSIDDEIPGSRTKSPFPAAPIIGTGIVVFIVLASCSATVAYLILKRRKAKDILRQLTEAEIREFLEGTVNFSADGGCKRSVDVNTNVISMPYNRSFEIPREKLKIDETTVLGQGAFGVVWKGAIIESNGDGILVAVKSVKRNVGVLYFKALLSELKIMAYIGGGHPNIVSLVGACTHNIQKREVYIALQYCANGNFHNYLRCRRDQFFNMLVDGNFQLANPTAYSRINSAKQRITKTISSLDLLKWATQIANGLQYLESKSVIHGDLATRNILLDDNRIAKIGDFGLSRRLIDYSNYYDINNKSTLSKTPLPWKWMSPEAMKDLKFSKKSDIWSYGMVLWEIFTLGQTPYPGLNWDPNFVERLEKGMRPWKPKYSTAFLFDIMCDCWNLDPFDRPSILDIKRSLENMTLAVYRQKKDESYVRFAAAQPYITLLAEDDNGYLEPNNPKQKTHTET